MHRLSHVALQILGAPGADIGFAKLCPGREQPVSVWLGKSQAVAVPCLAEIRRPRARSRSEMGVLAESPDVAAESRKSDG
jgi:hypothetical protein